MFDRPTEAAANAGSAQTAELQTAEHAETQNVESLCALYDGLLQASNAPLSAEAASELHAMAAIFDLDTDRPDAEVWKDVRAVVTRQAAPESAVLPLAETTDPLTILVVEDDAETATDIVETLSDAGHSVVGPFQTAEAAEAAAGLHVIDLALLDINLSSETTGVELAQSLKSRWGTNIIFVSGDVTAAAKHAHLAEAMLIKPYTGAQLLGAIARFGEAGPART